MKSGKLHRHRLGRPRTLNCFLFAAWLVIHGRVRSLRYRYPAHFLGVTRRGNVVHFRTLGLGDGCKPLWFVGQVEVFRPKVA